MGNFEKAVKVVLEHEGGYVFNPHDPGGETKYGISKRSYPHLDIKNLTEDEAKEIYRRDFWNKMNLDEICDDLATEVFDFAVNAGIRQASIFLQKAYNKIVKVVNPFENFLVEDGIIGPKTIASISSMCQEWEKGLLCVYRALEVDYYLEISYKSAGKFLKGWLNRV